MRVDFRQLWSNGIGEEPRGRNHGGGITGEEQGGSGKAIPKD